MRSSSSEERVERDVEPNGPAILKKRLQNHPPYTYNMHRAAFQIDEPSLLE